MDQSLSDLEWCTTCIRFYSGSRGSGSCGGGSPVTCEPLGGEGMAGKWQGLFYSTLGFLYSQVVNIKNAYNYHHIVERLSSKIFFFSLKTAVVAYKIRSLENNLLFPIVSELFQLCFFKYTFNNCQVLHFLDDNSTIDPFE